MSIADALEAIVDAVNNLLESVVEFITSVTLAGITSHNNDVRYAARYDGKWIDKAEGRVGEWLVTTKNFK